MKLIINQKENLWEAHELDETYYNGGGSKREKIERKNTVIKSKIEAET